MLTEKGNYKIGGREFRLVPFVPRVQREFTLFMQELLSNIKQHNGLEETIDKFLNKERDNKNIDTEALIEISRVIIDYESQICDLLLVEKSAQNELLAKSERGKFFDDNLELSTFQEVITDFFISGEGRSMLMLLYSLIGLKRQINGAVANAQQAE